MLEWLECGKPRPRWGQVMTDKGETGDGAATETGGSRSLTEILERAETAGEALGLLGEFYPGAQPAEILAALEAHASALRRRAAEMTGEVAAIERLNAVLEELVRRLHNDDERR